VVVVNRIEEDANRMVEWVVHNLCECWIVGIQIICTPQTLHLSREIQYIGAVRVNRSRLHSIGIADALPGITPIGCTVEAAYLIGRTSPVAEYSNVPCVLICVIGVNNQVLGPSAHVWRAPVQPRHTPIGADKDA